MARRRRGNGEGSIVQRSDGRWQASINVDGKRVYFYGKSRKEAQQKLDRARHQSANGINVASDQMTIETFLEFWLREVAAPNVRPSTLKVYANKVNTYLIPYLGKIKIQRLTPQMIVIYQNTLIKAGKSPRIVRDTKTVLSMALKQAMTWGIVSRNVASLVTSPTIETPDPVVPSTGEIRRLLDIAETTTESLIVAFGALLGMRSAEVRALRWADVDIPNKTIEIRSQIALQPQGAPEFTPLKTKASRRSLPIPDPVLSLLHQHKAAQLRERMTFVSIWNDYDLVLCSQLGETISSGMLLYRLRAICTRAGLPQYRYHSLRHACASMLADMGVPIKTAMDILGHVDPTVTQRVYTHSYPEAKQRALDGLGAMLEQAG